MKQEQITLRCEDGAEAVVFTKYNFNGTVQELTNGHSSCKDCFEISVQDDYIGGDYKGFFGRIKRAWRAFWNKPVVYTAIYCGDANEMKKFLIDCLNLVDARIRINEPGVYYAQSSAKDGPDEQPFLKGLYKEDDCATSNEELVKANNNHFNAETPDSSDMYGLEL